MQNVPLHHTHRKDPVALSARVGLAMTGLLLILLFWTTWSQNIFGTYGLTPHGYCFLWNTRLVALHVISDSLIGLSYVSISVTLTYFVIKMYRDLPFRWIFVAFGGFIVACGITHFFEIWTLWYALYWLSGTAKLVTAAISLSTAVILPSLVPKVQVLIESAKASEERKRQLEDAHRELERLYQQAQELDQLKTRFFAEVSHELRTPLTLILSAVHTLCTEQSGPDLEVIRRNALTLLKCINDQLDIAKIEIGKMRISYRRTDIADLFRLCIGHFENLAQRHSIVEEVNAPPSLIAEVDAEKLQRVFLNLLSNAFKFTPPGGAIRCSLSQDGDTATISIEDTGPGVPEEARQTIFEPFEQVEERRRSRGGSTGLGLAIARNFVMLHNGTISVGESPGGGACFTVCLPLRAPASTLVAGTEDASTLVEAQEVELIDVETSIEPERVQPGEVDAQEIQPRRPLILIVEDHPDMSRYLARLLAINYQTARAHDAAEGLTKARASQPSLILCDVMMPGMSGDQFVKALRADPELSAIPLIILSAQADDMLRIQLLQEGAQDYIVKPFLVEELYARIANLLNVQQARKVLQQALASRSQDIVSLTNQVIVRNRELVEINEELTQMNQLQKDFVSIVSHEFRTTLTSIQGFSELLHTREFSSEEVKSFSVDIHTDALRLNRMITDLLDLERMKYGKMPMNIESFDLNALLAETVEKMRPITSLKHTVRFQPDQALPPLRGDRDQLVQVMVNMLSNAVKYSPEGGEILVQSRLEEEFVHISVQDHGIGISAENCTKLFMPYSRIASTQTRYIKGTGLGLAIVQQISKMHGGQIWVESMPGQGSTFHVKLPLDAIQEQNNLNRICT